MIGTFWNLLSFTNSILRHQYQSVLDKIRYIFIICKGIKKDVKELVTVYEIW